jgi:hypothetical protein
MILVELLQKCPALVNRKQKCNDPQNLSVY